MNLPQAFTTRMNSMMSECGLDYDDFMRSFDRPGHKGIRLNRLKVASDDYKQLMHSLGEEGRPVFWCSSGFYIEGEHSGNDPYYHAGVYYPQEPSAMLPAEVMAAKPGDIVLDMCAAPGGKACRLGEDLRGQGLLVANEINENRAKALLRNIERMGIGNCVILNETPSNLAGKFNDFFDKILVDAPCSGEGMFRRDPNAVKSWERFGPDTCIPMQRDILENSHLMLKPGGELVYSTCTFGESENENMILEFISAHPEYEVIPHPEITGVTHAPDNSPLPGSMRIWPHLTDGDGHFCIHLRKNSLFREKQALTDTAGTHIPRYKRRRDDNYGFGKSREALCSFMSEILTDEKASKYEVYIRDKFVMHGSRLHILPVAEHLFDGLKVVKLGMFPGEIKNTTTHRVFVPSHSLALSLEFDDIRPEVIISLSRDDNRIIRYLKGETIVVGRDEFPSLITKGTVVIAVDLYPVGFGKISADGSIKNLYPKAWRLN